LLLCDFTTFSFLKKYSAFFFFVVVVVVVFFFFLAVAKVHDRG